MGACRPTPSEGTARPGNGTMVSMRSFLVALLLSVTAVSATDSTSGIKAVEKEELNFRRLANSTASDAHATAFLSSAAALTVIASMRGRDQFFLKVVPPQTGASK